MSWKLPAAPDSETHTGDPVELLIVPNIKDLGDFEVRRALPARQRQMVGPFIFFDHMGPTVFSAGQAVDVRPHPHIGLSTITWLFEGSIQHKDSLGSDIIIRPGEVNWMTAGAGIVHSERTPASDRNTGAPLGGIQTWVALPRDKEEIEPAFYHYDAGQIPQFDDKGIKISLIAGSAWGQTSPVRVESETLYAEVNLQEDTVFPIPVTAEERAVYVYEGELEINGAGFPQGSMVVFKPEVPVAVKALQATRFMLLGGASMDGPRHLYWNFVSSSRERIEQAKDDWLNKRFPAIEGDDEFIPLPGYQ